MRVAFNTRLLYAPTLRGWNRYTINLLVELAALGVKLFLYTDRPLHLSHLARLPTDSYCVRVAPAMRYIMWEQYWLPRQCFADRVDLLHTPLNFGLPWSSHCPRVLTLHDAIDQIYYKPQAAWQQRWNLRSLQSQLHHWISRTRAHQVITGSKHAKTDLTEQLRIPPHKITVIYDAADSRFHEPISTAARDVVRRKYQLTKPYVFYVGGWERRKNIAFLVQAFAAAELTDTSLVLAGGEDGQQSQFLNLAESLGIAHKLQLLGWVNDADLPALYSEALCFVYPSQYEGFGLQLCEAMAVGCPTLASSGTCLSEVLDSGGEIFSLGDHRNLATLLRRMAHNADYRANLVAQAKKRALNFSWQRTGKQTLSVYLRAMGAK